MAPGRIDSVLVSALVETISPSRNGSMETEMKKARTLYTSPNGDRWYLIRDASEAVFVRHEANAASGRNVVLTGVGEFLTAGQGPEQQELLRLIGTLVEDDSVR